MARDLTVHPHGEAMYQASQARPDEWHKQLYISHTVGYREHGNRFLSPADEIIRGHYAHHEYTGEEHRDNQVVLFLINGYWGFENVEGTEPVVMDMEAYRRWHNAHHPEQYQAKQARTLGGDRDITFAPDDPRIRFSYIARGDYSRQADIIILNNLRVGHSRLPGRYLPPLEAMRRPLYQCSFNVGLSGDFPVFDYVDEAPDYKKESLKSRILGFLTPPTRV
jgi:hypothetical protein